MLGRLRFRLLRLGLLFAAQGTNERSNELLTSKPVGHHPLERTANPLLILTNQIDRGLCLAHTLRGFERCVSPDVASLEPAIGKVLHRTERAIPSRRADQGRDSGAAEIRAGRAASTVCAAVQST